MVIPFNMSIIESRFLFTAQHTLIMDSPTKNILYRNLSKAKQIKTGK